MVQSMKGAPEVLANVFNLVMATGFFPSQWKVHKTVMLPKHCGNSRQVGNWIPITIGSIISRLYIGILDTRLSKCKLGSCRPTGVPRTS